MGNVIEMGEMNSYMEKMIYDSGIAATISKFLHFTLFLLYQSFTHSTILLLYEFQ